MNLLKTISNKKYLFLDRDGVINQRVYGGYITRITDFELLSDFSDSIKNLSKRFSKVVVVTNQQGIGKGLMTESDLNTIHSHLLKKVKELGGRIDAIYYCPDLKETPNSCRKPGIEMALKAKTDFPEIDFAESVMVGDTMSDLEFARNAQMTAVLLLTEHTTEAEKTLADICINSLDELNNLLK